MRALLGAPIKRSLGEIRGAELYSVQGGMERWNFLNQGFNLGLHMLNSNIFQPELGGSWVNIILKEAMAREQGDNI